MLKGSKDLSEWADPALSLEAALVGHRFKDSLAMEQTVLIEVTKVEELNWVAFKQGEDGLIVVVFALVLIRSGFLDVRDELLGLLLVDGGRI